jgi:hypothetical protein
MDGAWFLDGSVDAGDAALAADRVVGCGDRAAEAVDEVVRQGLLVGEADRGERQAPVRVLVAALGQEVDGGDVDRVAVDDGAVRSR